MNRQQRETEWTAHKQGAMRAALNGGVVTGFADGVPDSWWGGGQGWGLGWGLERCLKEVQLEFRSARQGVWLGRKFDL